MISLKAADPNDQPKLDDEIRHLESFFLTVESSDQVGERSAAATKLKNSFVKINHFIGKSEGDSNRFGMRSIWEGADSSGVARELERAKQLILEFEINNKNLALAEACFRDEVERLQGELERATKIQEGIASGNHPGRIWTRKDFWTGTFGLSLLLSIAVSGVFRTFGWVNVFVVSVTIIIIISVGFRHFSAFLLKVSDEAQYRVALCGDGAITVLKSLAFGFILLVIAGIAIKEAGLSSFLGVDLPLELSLNGITEWAMAASSGVLGVIFIAVGAGAFYFIRQRLRQFHLPPLLETLIS